MHRSVLLERITFGPAAGLAEQIDSVGAAGFLDQQLALAPAGTGGVLAGPHTLDATIEERFQAYRDLGTDQPARELRHAAVARAATHPGQLAELMVDFWTNHFSVYTGEDDKDVRFAAASDDRDVIRRHAMGRFADLLLANARSVSMLLYLDNFRSSASRPNQNYAREFVELHTMGAFNGYDEVDVESLARVFSGWTLAGRLGTDGLRYVYDPARHFSGPVSIDITAPDGTVNTWSTPGRTGPAGEADGIAVVDWVAHLPNTARFLAEKLVRRFVNDVPPAALVDSTAAVYLANDTQVVPVLRHILTSTEFINSQGAKIRTPFELIVGLLRSTDANVDPTLRGPATNTIHDQLVRLGQEMWSWPTPDGFPDNGAFWITTNTTLRRWELAGRLGNGTLGGITADMRALLPSPLPATIGEIVGALAARLSVEVTETEISAIATFLRVAVDAPAATVDLTRNLGDIVGLILSIPVNQYR